MQVKSALTSIGAIAGIYYGISKQKSFWVTAGVTLLFSLGGAALGHAYETISEKNSD